MKGYLPLGNADQSCAWREDPLHRTYLIEDARRQLAFFRNSVGADGALVRLDRLGRPLPNEPQPLHSTARFIYAYALAHAAGARDCAPMVRAGLNCLNTRHSDPKHGGYFWSYGPAAEVDTLKSGYGHVHVLLAAATALMAGFEQARQVLDEVVHVLDQYFWDPVMGLLDDDLERDWTPFSDYRGFNTNMHGVEAFLAAYEATGDQAHLGKAGHILRFFTKTIAEEHSWRLPEHFTRAWHVDLDYAGDTIFRPRGTTPGHSFETARLVLQFWELTGRVHEGLPRKARALVETALEDAWLEQGGLLYTLGYDGLPDVTDRYWWPVAEGISAIASLQKMDPRPTDETWYRTLWRSADALFVDKSLGGWLPEVGPLGAPQAKLFTGKPDLYHSLQANLLPLVPGLCHLVRALQASKPLQS